ncbi:forespore regulator of the sigma-K checkpoint [Scopulibacillus daqui]|uniref:Forespore regulator of the sigma-K checkpoint n=1 Tax=Scopulibacillus daqui TaxID=1469162 RepID=A0ABS2PXE0_9BACL|nr:BofC C-terminal domain-containing protein [Scopulibacillus daqui]MBM7644703.1 forespore regulator of the sigma-K checkpoint [Scopulibacillus daqui]
MIKLLFSFCITLYICFGIVPSNIHLAKAEQDESNVLHKPMPRVVRVHLKKDYLDGISIESTREAHLLSVKQYVAAFDDWRLVKQTKGSLYFEKKINDISPVAKAVGIFGLTNNGTLTIFEGNPDKNQIIQTFFQIDTKALEVNDYKHLNQGIPVRDKKHFQQVMKALAKYEEKHPSEGDPKA